jgi:hypothetical protein
VKIIQGKYVLTPKRIRLYNTKMVLRLNHTFLLLLETSICVMSRDFSCFRTVVSRMIGVGLSIVNSLYLDCKLFIFLFLGNSSPVSVAARFEAWALIAWKLKLWIGIPFNPFHHCIICRLGFPLRCPWCADVLLDRSDQSPVLSLP